MHREHHCCGSDSASRGPEIFYGYCHNTRQMRMMNYTDYVNNVQTGYTNLYTNPASVMQPMVNALAATGPSGGVAYQEHHDHHHHHHDHCHEDRHEHDCGCGCGSHEHDCGCGCGCHENDCGCSCCIGCADVVEYVRCGEIRRIPLTFDNDTRREREVKLQLGNFATEGGVDVGWKAVVSPAEFKLAPCGHTTVILSVEVLCGKLSPVSAPGTTEREPIADVESCKVAYATLRAEGCKICPLVIAVAVLPERCEAHHTNCLCSCCNCN